MVPRGEVHQGVHAGRVLAQGPLHAALRLDERAPVGGPEKPQAADAVADRHLVGGLVLVLLLHQLLDGQAVFRQALFDPRERQRQRRALALQAAGELGDERPDHRRVRPRHVGDRQDQALRVLHRDRRHLVGPEVGTVAVHAVGADPGRHAAQVLDEGQPHHDRDGPQLADGEGRHRLVGRHESAEALRVQPAVPVRDGLEREVVDPREPGRRPRGQARQFAAVARREVPPCRADLLLDQVEVVEQPLPGRRDAPVVVHGLRQQRPHGGEQRLVLREALQEGVRAARRAQPMGGGQYLAVQRHLLAAEQLRAQRRFSAGKGRREVRSAANRVTHASFWEAKAACRCSNVNRRTREPVYWEGPAFLKLCRYAPALTPGAPSLIKAVSALSSPARRFTWLPDPTERMRSSSWSSPRFAPPS